MKSKYKNFLDIHRFAVDQKDLSHADVFFSLTQEPKDHFMTLAFRGKDRVGYDGVWSSLLLNKKMEYPVALHETERYFQLLKFYQKQDKMELPKVRGKELIPPITDWDESPYILVNLPYDPINNEIPSDWIEFINLFEKRRVFVSVFNAPIDQRKVVIERFLDSLDMPIDIHPFYFEDLTQFAQMAAFAKGVIAHNSILTDVSTYLGTPSIILYETGQPQTTAPLYFVGTANIHSTSDMTLLKKKKDNNSQDMVTKFDLGMLFDKAFKFFELE